MKNQIKIRPINLHGHYQVAAACINSAPSTSAAAKKRLEDERKLATSSSKSNPCSKNNPCNSKCNESSLSDSENGRKIDSTASSNNSNIISENEVRETDEHSTLENKASDEFRTELPELETDIAEGKTSFLQLPDLMPMETEASDSKSLKDATPLEDPLMDDSRKAFVAKQKTNVRCRDTQDSVTGMIQKKSNARMVVRPDGSKIFHVGDKALDVAQHPVSKAQAILHARHQGPIQEFNFGQTHMQSMRRLTYHKPSNCVRMLIDHNINPLVDRKRKIKEERALIRKQNREKRLEQKNAKKTVVKPVKHCTADDSDKESTIIRNSNVNVVNPMRRTPGIRTNRNTNFKPPMYEDVSETDTSDSNDENYVVEQPTGSKPKLRTEQNSQMDPERLKKRLKRLHALFSDSD